MNPKGLRFFLDFDGTISTEDVVDKILERFADKEWRVIEKQWAAGVIGSRECLSRQMALVRAKPREFGRLLDAVNIDPYFVPFLRHARAAGVPVAVVSDGFDLVIGRVLERALGAESEIVRSIPVYSNHLEWRDGLLAAHFSEASCAHGCATCKERVIREIARPGETVVFVGDGWSDRFGASVSAFTFAKHRLLKFCREKKLPHRPYSNFKAVDAWLARETAVAAATRSAPVARTA